jgi:dolichol-phosphate mannosyltransferase
MPMTAGSTSNVLVVIPTYNERENLPSILQRLIHAIPDVHVLVVDDNSPDGTGDIADGFASTHSTVHVLHRQGKSGLGDAYRAGFTWGLAEGYERFVEMDGDGSHQPEQLLSLLAGTSHADVVLGSRWVAGGEVVDWPRRRVLLSRGGSLYARIALGLPFRDITGGYRVFTARALRTIGFDRVQSDGYSFQIEMLWSAYRSGLQVAELPITFVERQYGTSKMSLNIVTEAVLRIAGWALRGLPTRMRHIEPRVASAETSRI